jgi:hypothetical protein
MINVIIKINLYKIKNLKRNLPMCEEYPYMYIEMFYF